MRKQVLLIAIAGLFTFTLMSCRETKEETTETEEIIKEMEAELSQLKRMYADLALENRAMKDLIEKKL